MARIIDFYTGRAIEDTERLPQNAEEVRARESDAWILIAYHHVPGLGIPHAHFVHRDDFEIGRNWKSCRYRWISYGKDGHQMVMSTDRRIVRRSLRDYDAVIVVAFHEAFPGATLYQAEQSGTVAELQLANPASGPRVAKT